MHDLPSVICLTNRSGTFLLTWDDGRSAWVGDFRRCRPLRLVHPGGGDIIPVE